MQGSCLVLCNSMYVCMHAYVRMCVCTNLCIYVVVYAYACICVCMHAHLYLPHSSLWSSLSSRHSHILDVSWFICVHVRCVLRFACIFNYMNSTELYVSFCLPFFSPLNMFCRSAHISTCTFHILELNCWTAFCTIHPWRLSSLLP